ncbi:hypothetical protein Q9L58_000159 [Maublancomyces gigas]|uniref:UvrD-like helicase ATP-binding domain-containing protein n=1 Tax=Discina gigas TaxID=1032678 RepID=A0ABR3GY76_9PEZI
MADYKFVELVFEPEPIGPISFRVAQNSLVRNPRQLFALLVEKDISTTFLSRLKTRGQQLAKLLDQFREFTLSPLEFQLKTRLLEESLQAFLFSLLANDFADFGSQESVAEIIVSIVKLHVSNPEALGLLGARLGETPGILKRLIAGCHLRSLSRDRPTFIRSIISNPTTSRTWAGIISDLMRECTHNGISQARVGWEDMEAFISSFQPWCHLGPWKIVLSAQALQDLKESVSSGDFPHIREKLFELASGNWTPKSLVTTARNDSKYQVPVFKAIWKMDAVILWQVDVGFDERYYDNFQVLKAKFYSLTDIVLETILSGAPRAVFPIDVAAEEVHVIDHFQTPAFILGRSGTGKTTCLIYKLASRYLTSKNTGENVVRQLLLTRSRNLAQKLKIYTKRLINTKMGRVNTGPQDGEDDSAGSRDDSEESTDQTLLALDEEDFPLVCTFSYFLILLENTIRIPKDLAFVEIMGVIKGSASLASNLEPLSRDEYLYRRWRLAPNFERDDRDAVYSLYEFYERMKKTRGETDNIDRVIHIMKALNKNPELRCVVGGLLDEVYVDVGSDLMVLLQEKDSFIKHDAEVKEFGEPRAILVRDEQTRRKLRKEVKDFALVLTILQSKGMEFEDVFLYDFFTTSPYGSDFAILEEILDGHSMGMFLAND